MDFWTRNEWSKIQPKDLWKDECPFCEPQKTPLIKEFNHWFVCHNKYPYGWLKDNLLVIPKKHRKYTYELDSQEWSEFPTVEKFIHEYFGETDYFSFIRQSCKWRSLEHLHYHYLPGFISGAHVEHILQNQK
jgi:diadenosine tetraphosphate (Ap4A) HIT family hydrolase